MGLCSLTCFRINLVFLFLFRGSQTKKTCRKCSHVYCVIKSCGRVLFPKTNDRLCCRLVTLDHLSKDPVYTNKTGATSTTMWGIRRIWMRISPLNSPQHSGSASWPAFSSLAPSFDRRPPQRMLTSVELLLLIPRMKPSLLNLCGAFSSEIYLSCLSGEVTFSLCSLEAYFWLSHVQPRQPDTFNHAMEI